CWIPSVMAGLEEWSSRRSGCRKAAARADRIRLIGPLRHFSHGHETNGSRVGRSMKRRLVVMLWAAGLAAAIGAALVAQQGPLGPGTQRGRPGAGRTPEFPPPSIVDYRPRSTLVVPEHPVPRAKFPVIDIHSHQPTPISAEQFDRVVQGMEQNNLRVLVNLSGGSGDKLKQGLDAIAKSPHRDRMVLFANVDFSGAGTPGWAAQAARQLEADITAGARGLKIFKDLG